ncbi:MULTISPECIES: hypothetical protein [Modicisalibacter]|nr:MULTISPECIES: hypothetical protein [Halomonadaceae]MBZ9557977.1 hypothetical protein [Modicisalibacter sp. R2A 31.J]MBZ9573355.1 hypothetical protein [Modicisalibacter sp. MOD 31.J]
MKTQETAPAKLSLSKRIGKAAYRVLEAMTESAYQGFLAQGGLRYGID